MATVSEKSNTGNLALVQSGATFEPDINMPRYTRRETLLTMAGILLVMLLASLDQTIVSTAMPHIISELQGFDRYTWVTTAYLLTSTVMVPIYGKLSDLFGRKSIFLVGVVLFLTGSALSGASQTMTQLIAFRAFQGLGAAALLPIAIAVVGDLFTPRERGKWQGLTGAVFGLSSIVGPVAGGWITENASWRWVFYVNLPIGIVALLVLIFLMPTLRTTNTNKKVSIDYLGAAFLILGTVPLLLAFTWAGSQYAWISPQIIGLMAVALAFLTSFVFYETRLERLHAEPIINPGLFKNRSFTISVFMTMITSIGMFGSIFFLPLFAQGVLGVSATASGLILTPLMIALITSSVISGQLVSRLGRYKWIAISGMAITLVGSLLLVRLGINSTTTDLMVATIVLGAGLGFSMSLYSLVVQNALPRQIGQVTSALTFFRSIGSTFALAAMGSIMTGAYIPAFHNAIPAQLKKVVPANILTAFDNTNILLSADMQKLIRKQFTNFGSQGTVFYNQLMEAVKVGLTTGIHNVYVLSFGLMIIGMVIVFFLPELPLRGGPSPAPKQSTEHEVENKVPTMMH